MTIVCTLIRHGQTLNNSKKIVQSRTDGELSEEGIRMAQVLGEYLKDEKFTQIFSSDLKRVRDTTKHFVSKLKGPVPEVQFTPLLRERDLGDWEFTTDAYVDEQILEQGFPLHKGHRSVAPNGECYEECVERVGKFFSEILKLVDDAESNGNPSDENIAILSHGIYINCVLEYFLENPDEFQLVDFPQEIWEKLMESPNTARTRFTIKTEPSASSSSDSGEEKKPKRILTFTNFFDAQHLKVKSTDN